MNQPAECGFFDDEACLRFLKTRLSEDAFRVMFSLMKRPLHAADALRRGNTVERFPDLTVDQDALCPLRCLIGAAEDDGLATDCTLDALMYDEDGLITDEFKDLMLDITEAMLDLPPEEKPAVVRSVKEMSSLLDALFRLKEEEIIDLCSTDEFECDLTELGVLNQSVKVFLEQAPIYA